MFLYFLFPPFFLVLFCLHLVAAAFKVVCLSNSSDAYVYICRLFVPFTLCCSATAAVCSDEKDTFGRFRDGLRGLIRLCDSTLCCIVGRHRCRTLGIIIKSTVATRVLLLLLPLCSFLFPKVSSKTAEN